MIMNKGGACLCECTHPGVCVVCVCVCVCKCIVAWCNTALLSKTVGYYY